MLDRAVLVGCAAALVVSVGAAATKQTEPKECPASEHTLEAVQAAVGAPVSCEASLQVFEACAYGASGDVSLGAIVVEKCEGDFLSKLSKAQRRAYDQEQRHCDRKYRNELGTMYRSFEAFCRAKVAQTYSRRALRSKGGGGRLK